MHIMTDIYLEDSQSHQKLIYSIAPSLTGVRRNNMIPLEAITMQKQEQCTQECYIKIGSENYLDKLVTPYDLHKNYTRITKQQLR